MAKDASKKSDVTRIDLRIPNHIFKEIEDLAIATNQPKHHISGKVITTPVILNLINLGLEVVQKENFGIEAIASKDSLKESEIEKRVVNSLLQNLEAIVSDKLTDIVRKEVNDCQSKITSNIISHNEAVINLNIPKEDPPENTEALTEDNKESAIENEYVKNLNAIEVKSEVIEVSALEVSNEDTEAITPPVDNEPNSEGLSMSKLAQRFKTNKNKGEGASKTSISTKVKKLSKEDFIKWTQENDPESKGWYLNEADNKFYSVN